MERPACAGASPQEETRYGAPTMGTQWDITVSITLPHPDTSPAEQHHPLSQPDISLGARWAASAADMRSHGVFPPGLCLLLTPCSSFCLPSQGPGAHGPFVPAASHPTQGHRQGAEHLHMGENTIGVTRVSSCHCSEKLR